MAKVGGAELLRSLRAEADRISALGKELRERIDVLTDPQAGDGACEDPGGVARGTADAADSEDNTVIHAAGCLECRARDRRSARTRVLLMPVRNSRRMRKRWRTPGQAAGETRPGHLPITGVG